MARSWFAKVINSKAQDGPVEEVSKNSVGEPESAQKQEMKSPMAAAQRRTIQAPILAEPATAMTGEIRIKAHINRADNQIILMVDRPLLKGYSCWCANAASATAQSPLAQSLFGCAHVDNVLIHNMNVTIGVSNTLSEDIEDFTRRLAKALREHLVAGLAVVSEAFLAAMPSEEQVRQGLQRVIDDEVNPGIAAHSGTITLTAVKGNSAYIRMGGGCQGCAASTITLRGGVEQAFRAAVPGLGALFDETDHTEGNNPFFTELPAGMSA